MYILAVLWAILVGALIGVIQDTNSLMKEIRRRWRNRRRGKCNTCGKPLWLPIGADHLVCALRHPFRSLLGWILVGSWKLLDIVGCPAAEWLMLKEALLKRQIRKEAFRKGIRPGGKRS